MKIVLVEPLGVEISKLNDLKSHFERKGHSLTFYSDRKENPSDIIKRCGDAEILTISNIPVTKEIIDACPNLKLINVAFTGYDHIDFDTCKTRNISVCNAAGYSTPAVAELSIGLAIDLLRNTVKMESNTRIPSDRQGFLGLELAKKTVGIIGAGTIGLYTANLFKSFGCNILAYSRTVKSIEGIEFVSLEELLKKSDIVSLHIPSNNETKNLINAERISLMKKSAVLINTARGPIIDSQAVADALNKNHIAGAALDVYEKEPPLPANHPLLSTPNTILTPHIAYATKESMIRRLEIVKTNIESFIDGNLENRII